MKSASPALIDYLNSNTTFLWADLYLFSLVGGFQVGYTDKERAFTVGGVTYNPFLIARTKTRIMVGTEVDTMTLTVSAGPSDTLNGVPWMQAVRTGMLDGANVQVYRLFMPTWGDTSLGTVMLFDGRIAGVEPGRSEARLTVKSPLELLDVQMPRNVYQSGCMNTLYDSGCKLAKSTYAVGYSVLAGSTASNIVVSAAYPGGYFTLGSLTFSTGVNAGLTRSIRSFDGVNIALALPLPVAPAAGDVLYAYPGCDKTMATCGNKFSNLVNFRGQPFIPDPETGI